ncbi:MAG: zinc-binding dehydrogenase [Planctomycetota bacterium]|nr:zinc-binding dehydrogenase [Planctomycetota bacterium]
MKALVLEELKQPLRLQERPDPTPGPGEVVVSLHAASLNRRDYWITQGLYPGIRTPVVLGSDGAGVVSSAGEAVDQELAGREVLIHPARDWGDDPAAQGDDFEVLGMPGDGTFATHLLTTPDRLHPRPAHLSMFETAALPIAALTAWRALFTQGRLQAGQKTLITGIGGGVALFCVQFASAVGAEVFVTSSSEEKISRALELGASAGVNYRDDGWARDFRARHGQLDLIVDGAGGRDYASLLDIARPAGRIVNYGSTAGAPEGLDLFRLFWKQVRIIGSTLGTTSEMTAMLEFISERELRPVIDSVHPLSEVNTALDCMKNQSQLGKLVLDCGGS